MTRNLKQIHGQPSWSLSNDVAELHVTRTGAHVAPVRLRAGSRWIEPLAIAPWATEDQPDLPPVLRVMRGDFFCMPFGDNATPFEQEQHPVHGETANADWSLHDTIEEDDLRALTLELQTTVRPARVRKTIALREGHPAIYQRHTISGASGPMCLGHHVILKFPSTGLVSTGPFVRGQVLPVRFEDPASGGYQALKVGAMFDRLDDVPLATGELTDLSQYPAREGFEDLVQVFADPALPFAWTTVSFPDERYLWFALKDPRTLSGTVLWMSNGGRHYAPWRGRHRAVMGVEETTSYFHLGLSESAAQNPAAREGLRTSLPLDPRHPLVINYLFGVVEIPPGFGRVERVERDASRATFHSANQTVIAPVDWHWLEQQ